MKEKRIDHGSAGQSLFKYIMKVLNKAPNGLVYKWLRKKSIDVNRKKCDGKELLREGDIVHFWLSEETFQKFSSQAEAETASAWRGTVPDILYEDEDVLILNKPAGLLTQRDGSGMISLNDWVLLHCPPREGVKPSVCNRLDRNTSGLVLCGKSIRGLQELGRILRERSVHKYYRTWLWGTLSGEGRLKGFLAKDVRKNQADIQAEERIGAVPVETGYRVLSHSTINGAVLTEAELLLVTGRTHQLRAHMASIGHPILGDRKYGIPASISFSRQHHLRRQLLHAEQIVFPYTELLPALSLRTITAPIPADFIIR